MNEKVDCDKESEANQCAAQHTVHASRHAYPEAYSRAARAVRVMRATCAGCGAHVSAQIVWCTTRAGR